MINRINNMECGYMIMICIALSLSTAAIHADWAPPPHSLSGITGKTEFYYDAKHPMCAGAESCIIKTNSKGIRYYHRLWQDGVRIKADGHPPIPIDNPYDLQTNPTQTEKQRLRLESIVGWSGNEVKS